MAFREGGSKFSSLLASNFRVYIGRRREGEKDIKRVSTGLCGIRGY